jgi:hypothetical protein
MELHATALWMSPLEGGTDRQFVAMERPLRATFRPSSRSSFGTNAGSDAGLAAACLKTRKTSQEVFLRAFRFLHRFDPRRPSSRGC